MQVQTILTKYDFVETVKSLQIKYGELPDGWGSYLERVFDSVSGAPKNMIVEASKENTVVVKCKAGTTVRWAYAKNMDEQVDIGFEVTFIGKDYGNFNENTTVVPAGRAHLPLFPAGLDGGYEAQEVGDLHIKFDNTYSWLKSKAIVFKTDVANGRED